MSESPEYHYKFLLEYDGSSFHGWQANHDLLTVEKTLADTIARVIGYVPKLSVAGRTDAGVHALGQVVSFYSRKYLAAWVMQRAINAHLRPHPIAVLNAEIVTDPYFHPRFSARQRVYNYHIINRSAPLTVWRDRAWLVVAPLDVAQMQAAAQMFVGEHDFTTFRSTECQAKSPLRTIDECYLEDRGEGHLVLHIAARSFLHHQVRNIVGALQWVGRGRWSLEQLEQAFAAADRRHGAVMAPACGLYLMKVVY